MTPSHGRRQTSAENRHTAAESTVLPEAQAWKAMFALSLGFFMSLLDQTLVAVALPSIRREFDASLAQTLWVSSGFLLFVVVPLLFTGRLGDRFGQRRLFRIGITVFVIGAVASATASSIELLIAARCLQGLGASIQMPQTMSVINRVFARERRGRALGVWGIIGSVAAITGPVLGGALINSSSWQAVFLIHVPLGVLAVVLATLWVPRMPTYARKLDPLSVAVSLLSMLLLVGAIQQAPEADWAWWIWLMLLAGIAGLYGFIRLQATAQARGMEAMIPLFLFRNHNYRLGIIIIACMGFMAASLMLPIMLWLQDGQGLDSASAGLLMVPMALTSLFVSPIAGIMADKFHPRNLVVAGFSTMLSACAACWWIMAHEFPLWWLAVAVSLLGIGQSFVWGTNSATTMRDVEPRIMGAASGVYNTARQLGSVFGVSILSALLQITVAASGLAVGAANALLLLVVVLAIGLLTSLFYRKTI
ncbi:MULTISPECIES: MFS transporter [Corynebacterium]|uniref:MFS transporter n=1 Tax=Corynebacterium pseudodiphtheriticum TaxID=37637 RepID=A0AAP4BQ46_9CORY|nr:MULTISPECIES: MFS transporter [Corynebacterium]MDK4205950.1 MFS transporter [Corynebacterium pseudodiphtheriticum]MDK4227860.1 MFS transporter [Corynebacterium pseudodiphtheriticum]MDK4236223.1 MFS transporter [Corynebacterium pseudodiphtheriticum]MDK4249057.1 MFS transporter [Corynebacterium pseudodiphtheriticum]MDK4272850.1 MFS transporter [Corynebacterium pseudodiphtheriticum]